MMFAMMMLGYDGMTRSSLNRDRSVIVRRRSFPVNRR
jgi:hypothetical protein